MKTVLTTYWQSLSPALRRYYRASVLPGVLFVALAMIHEGASQLPQLALPWRIVFALLPVLALAWMFTFYLRFLRECDELERRIELGALAWAAGIAMLGIMAALFLLDAGLLAMPAKDVVAYLGLSVAIGYALIRGLLHRRYA